MPGWPSQTKESTLGRDSSVPLMQYDLSTLGLICLVKKRKLHCSVDLIVQSWTSPKKFTIN